MNSNLTIDDLKYDELRLILNTLSVRQLFHCLRVSKKWNQIIKDLLHSKKVLALDYNDINYYTKQEMSKMCNTSSHLAINSSIGRIIGSKSKISVFISLRFSDIRHQLLNLLSDYCPNIQSLDLRQYSVNSSDIQTICSNCPLLQCLSITSNETNWTNFLCPQIIVLKHFRLSLTSRREMSKKVDQLFESIEVLPQIEELVIDNTFLNEWNFDIFCSFIQLICSQLKKFHLNDSNFMTTEYVINLFNSLTSNQTNKSNIKNLNLNVYLFDGYLSSIKNNFFRIETIYLYFSETQTNDSMKELIHLKELKNLKEIYLNFSSFINIFDFGLHSITDTQLDNSLQYQSIVPKIPPTLTKLILSDALISLSDFTITLNYLPLLEQLELNYVCIKIDFEGNFWQVISNFKRLWSLTLQQTDICDEGFERVINSESLNTLELIKYKGPKAGETLIDSNKIIVLFGHLASLKPNQWFHLRLDIDVFEVNEEIKRQIPRNVNILNVGHKK